MVKMRGTCKVAQRVTQRYHKVAIGQPVMCADALVSRYGADEGRPVYRRWSKTLLSSGDELAARHRRHAGPGTAANGTAVEIKDPKQNSGGQRKRRIRSRRYGSKQNELTDSAAHD